MAKGKVVQNTVMLYLMNFAKIALPLITLPYLTRVLSLNNYGTFTYVKTVMTYMQLIIDFGFLFSATKDIVEAGKDKKKIGSITGNVLIAKFILSFFSLLFLIILMIFIPLLRRNILFTLVSFVPVFLTVFLFDFLFRGIEEMQIITFRYILMKGISTGLTFIFVKGNNDLMWIPILDIIGTLVAILWVWRTMNRMGIVLSFGTLKEAFNKIKISAVYFVSDIVSTAFGALNTLIIGILLSSSDVALFGLVSQLVAAVQAMYTPIVNGIYPEMVKTKSLNLIKKVLYIFMPLITIGCLIVFFGAGIILSIIGGSKYIGAGTVLKLMIPVLFFSFPEMLFSWPVLGVIDKVKETTATTIEATIVQITGLLLLIIFNVFTLNTITILRGITEFILFVLRWTIFWKNRYRFNK
ncbi:oligosaccharide flippase family protein [Limosilactobacillus reuteri]|uniref:oligosaccharide flippase family protein n=1 Tax=Limosilactobacillus reuteri TaxID=1598 RepID=UPI001E3CD137|nr:oligosaccharide flippase family protein [Limosilactobacillus reuteri]MCC4439776.1 oligosaccharide flippase family protein [Limosilactobacillus reuteri]